MASGEDKDNKKRLTDFARRAASIARNAHLRAINLRRLDVALLFEPTEDSVPASVHSEHGVVHHLRRNEDAAQLSIHVHFNVTVKSADRELLTLKATFGVDYDLNRGMPESTVADIPAFAATNTMVHVWPYYRELVQSTAWRMGIPPFPLPLFRVFSGETEGEKKEPAAGN